MGVLVTIRNVPFANGDSWFSLRGGALDHGWSRNQELPLLWTLGVQACIGRQGAGLGQ